MSDDKSRMAKALNNYNNGEAAANPNLGYAVQVNYKRVLICGLDVIVNRVPYLILHLRY